MSVLKNIQAPIENEIKEFESYFKKSLQSDIPFLGTILNFLYRTGGKQIRTMFVFLSAKMIGETNEFSQLAACSIELLHTATLVHDDVVDESYERRGTFSVKALWKNKLAVLVGDYILAKGLLLMLENRKYNFLHIISEAVKDMSEGEAIQIKRSRNLDIDYDTYFEIIKKKTASLIATSMSIGAASATTDEAIHNKMYKIGQDAGIAFQIRDDILDYQVKGFTGKPAGNDIKEKKITLPLLYVLNNSSCAERKRILRLIKHNNNPAVVREIIQLVTEKGGLVYASQKMEEFKDRAISGLMEFEDSQARNSLIELMKYITTRKK
ncbi:MAG: polyprenyl synthetase family protein [Bacteroidales bacterium]|jgi:octaprenyl-diphosphate synthase|nr:polyprenyl synthetase family protein [Bacteroidales bacterium]